MTLEWAEQSAGDFLATGKSDQYLITRDSHGIVLTRWGRHFGPFAAARQAAVNAVRIDGAFSVLPESAAAVITHMKQVAQAREAGLDVPGCPPSWRHGEEQG